MLRTGRSSLKVKKGPNGHFLDKKCNEELKKSLPEESYVELMNWVDSWLKKLDQRNRDCTKKDIDQKPGVKPKESSSTGNESFGNLSDLKEADGIGSADFKETFLKGVIDLCSDEEIEDFRDGISDIPETDSVSSRTSVETLMNRSEIFKNKIEPRASTTFRSSEEKTSKNTNTMTSSGKKTLILNKIKLKFPEDLTKKEDPQLKALNTHISTHPSKIITPLNSKTGPAENYQCVALKPNISLPKQGNILNGLKTISITNNTQKIIQVCKSPKETENAPQKIFPKPLLIADGKPRSLANNQENHKEVFIKAPKPTDPATTANLTKPIVTPAAVPVVVLKRKHSESNSTSDSSQGPAKRPAFRIQIPRDSAAIIPPTKKTHITPTPTHPGKIVHPQIQKTTGVQINNFRLGNITSTPATKVLPIQNPSKELAKSKQGPSTGSGVQLRKSLITTTIKISPSITQEPVKSTGVQTCNSRVISTSNTPAIKILPIQNPSRALVKSTEETSKSLGVSDRITPTIKVLPIQNSLNRLASSSQEAAKTSGVRIINSRVSSSLTTTAIKVLPTKKPSSVLGNSKMALQELSDVQYSKLFKNLCNSKDSSTTKEMPAESQLCELGKILDTLDSVENFSVRHTNEEAFILIKKLRVSLIKGLNI